MKLRDNQTMSFHKNKNKIQNGTILYQLTFSLFLLLRERRSLLITKGFKNISLLLYEICSEKPTQV